MTEVCVVSVEIWIRPCGNRPDIKNIPQPVKLELQQFFSRYTVGCYGSEMGRKG